MVERSEARVGTGTSVQGSLGRWSSLERRLWGSGNVDRVLVVV